jgi:hypothetical protein
MRAEQQRVRVWWRATYTPGAEGSGSTEGMEPPWKSLSVIVVTAFFFDMAETGAEAVELRRSRWMGSCDSFGAPDRSARPRR